MKEIFNKPAHRSGAALVVGALIVTLSCAATSRFVKAEDSPRVTPVTLTINDAPISHGGLNTTSFAPMVKQVAQSVVKVTVSAKSRGMDGQDSSPMNNDDLLRRFFGDQFANPRGQQHSRNNNTSRTPHEYGLGSGVIVNKDGYILTNNHVVDGADVIKVTLNDGREFTAKVIGRDPKTDIAVVKIDAKNLPFITIADSDKIDVGDLCLAIGNPYGIGQTVTMGIISAKGRGNVDVGTDYEDFIQTDAAINPGNSGGALVDADGRLVGINTAILSRSGGYQGIGFAVPINMAKNVMESLIAHGKVIRGFLGVSIQDVTPELAQEFKLPNNQGALVGDITPHSPADKAGIKSGDVIVEFNGKPVTDSRHLKLEVGETEPGQKASVKLYREGHEKTFEVAVKELPGSEELASNDATTDNSSDTLNGVGVSDIDSQAKEQLKLPDNMKGAVVTDVDQDSVAFEAGLRPGDVIEEINHKPVASGDDAVKLTSHVKEKVVLLKIWSKGASHYLVVDESKAG
ncbi:MAG TPA: DegQ family serine endoprotease [Verrucomicrobiae bacterium]|jgi:serine protease Do|nr:DegQ family serine endoprotease [Verrucomicrobiae bacterium]